jgi:hypothetical protein
MDARIRQQRPIRLFSNYSLSELLELLEISSGLRPATASDGAYKDDAMVPKGPWQPLTSSEMSTLFHLTHEWEHHRSVAILKSGAGLQSLVAKEQLATKDLQRINFPDVSKAIVSALAEECEFAPDYVCHGIAVNDPDMLTVSINKAIGTLVGLHVDFWEGMPLAQRHTSGNRISINLGPSPRHIFFVPTTLEDMALLLQSERGMQVDLPYLPDIFMRQFADFPVIRCRLPPGTSYILPTENMLHDGSTTGQPVQNRQIVYRGQIRPQYTALAS